MGTVWRIVVCGVGEAEAQKAAQAAFDRVEALNLIMSDYDAHSEVRQLGVEWRKVSDDLFEVLEEASRLGHDTDGAFDVTGGQLTRVWRRAFRRKVLPTELVIQEAKALTGLALLELDHRRRRVRLAKAGVRVDLGGIGKGYALDSAFEVLVDEYGLRSVMIDAGGDVILGDPPPGEKGWRVGIEGNGAPFALVRSNVAIATSGDLYQGETIDGTRYSHLIDTRSGWAMTNGAAATVIAESASVADALASSLCVLDPDEGARLTKEKRAAARVTRRLPSGEMDSLTVGDLGLSPK